MLRTNYRRQKLSASLSPPPDPHRGHAIVTMLFPTCLTPLFKRKEKGNFLSQYTKSETLGINYIMVLEI